VHLLLEIGAFTPWKDKMSSAYSTTWEQPVLDLFVDCFQGFLAGYSHVYAHITCWKSFKKGVGPQKITPSNIQRLGPEKITTSNIQRLGPQKITT
jgi:hypothetical protein